MFEKFVDSHSADNVGAPVGAADVGSAVGTSPNSVNAADGKAVGLTVDAELGAALGAYV